MYNLLNIKEVAANKNISIKSLVSRIGISEPGFYKSLDNNSMNIKTLDKIAQVLNVTISELVGDKTGKSPESGLNKNEVASTPIGIYAPPIKSEDQLRIMYEQQLELGKQQKEIYELKMEVERLKKLCARVRSADAG